MSSFRSFLFSSLWFAAISPLSADDAASDRPIELDRVDVTTDKDYRPLPLDFVSATGSRLGLSLRELPASVSVITQDAIQLRGFRTAVEAVESAVGMTGGTQFGSIPGDATRGFTANNVTVMRDGIRQNTASQSSRSIDTFTLDRVEILKGPASLLFGEGAIGGAVNYVSKSPEAAARGELHVSFGSWETSRIAAGVGGPLSRTLTYRLDASRASTAGYVDRNAQRYFALSGAVRWAPSERVSVTFFSSYLRDHVESYYGTPVIYDAVDRYDPPTQSFTRLVTRANSATDRLVNPRIEARARRTNYNITDNFAKTENSFHRLRAEWSASPEIDVRNEAYVATQLLKWRNLESNVWNPASQRVELGEFLLIYRGDLLVGDRFDLTWRRPLAGRANRFLVGGIVERNALTRGGSAPGTPSSLGSTALLDPAPLAGPASLFTKIADVTIETSALFVEDVLNLTTSWKVVAGLRHERIEISRETLPSGARFNQRYRPWTGRIGTVWTVAKELNLYASYARAAEPVTQLVSLNVAQADFSLQTGRQYEIGAKGTLAGGRVDFTAALYDLEKNDLLTSTVDPVSGVRLQQQIGAQVSRGAELAVAFSPVREWRLEGNVAWTWRAEFEDFNENLGAGVVSRSSNTPANVPELVASLHATKSFGRRWRLGIGARHIGGRAANNANLIWMRDYTTVDASLTYAAGSWSCTLRGRNLLDREYEEWSAGSGLMRRLADPRSVELALKTTF